MSSKSKSKSREKENEENQKDSSSEEHIEPSFKSKLHKMFLDIEEKPEITIEKILINLFNKYINPSNANNEYSEMLIEQNKIELLCKKQEKSKIVYILLTKIRSLIQKYKEKLFELPNIIELREKIFQRLYNIFNFCEINMRFFFNHFSLIIINQELYLSNINIVEMIIINITFWNTYTSSS